MNQKKKINLEFYLITKILVHLIFTGYFKIVNSKGIISEKILK